MNGLMDCVFSDGKLTKECFEKPSDEELEKKQAEWRAKYDEWHTGKGKVVMIARVFFRAHWWLGLKRRFGRAAESRSCSR